MTTATNLLNVLPPEGREHLLRLSREVTFPAGERIFNEGRLADRFWIITTGRVDLDIHVPGRQAAVVESLGPGDLVGWSWLTEPHHWHLGAEAASTVRALEFDAVAVRAVCAAEPALGLALACRVAEIIGHRLQVARVRLLDLYGPYGSSTIPPSD
jgi:CRP-like cAMP-binding protein